MLSEKRFFCLEVPFSVGVEYSRAPTPKLECWDEDFVRLRATGFQIVQIVPIRIGWSHGQAAMNWMILIVCFDKAEKHGLFVWFDIMLVTHDGGRELPWATR